MEFFHLCVNLCLSLLHGCLMQIVGGIWADKIGGKLVLGFGVVWWSIATVLTPLAARIGLPFLLIMRAFMGIGEVVFFINFISLIHLKWLFYKLQTKKLRFYICLNFVITTLMILNDIVLEFSTVILWAVRGDILPFIISI